MADRQIGVARLKVPEQLPPGVPARRAMCEGPIFPEETRGLSGQMRGKARRGSLA